MKKSYNFKLHEVEYFNVFFAGKIFFIPELICMNLGTQTYLRFKTDENDTICDFVNLKEITKIEFVVHTKEGLHSFDINLVL